MPLSREASLGVGLATAGLVVAVHMSGRPTAADIRVAEPNDEDIEASTRAAGWISLGVVGFVSLIAKDPTIFVIGGMTDLALIWWARHSNTVNPLSRTLSVEGGSDAADVQQVAVETDESEMYGDEYAA
jgi:hypothetical protein